MIEASDNVSVSINNCNFTENTAYVQGGTVGSTDTILRISNSIFHKNYVSSRGIIYSVGSNVFFAGNVEFSFNLGALYLYNSNASFTGNTTFTRCVFTEGGAIK